MAQYLGTVKLGGFYNNGAILKRPTKPWRPDDSAGGNSGYGDIPQMSGSMANYTFGDTPSADANKLQWVKIKDGDKTLLICDRVILVSVSWDDLNGQGYVTGKTITIDGAKYKCRLLTGGSNRRNNDWYAGGTPTNNEWDRFITREEVISGLPAPVSSDLDSSTNSTSTVPITSFGTGSGVYSWCQETYAEGASRRAIRGYFSARRWIWSGSSGRDASLGFRPVLEILNTDPLISDSDRNLGDKNQNFTIEYTVDDADSGDVLAATESIDGRTTKSFAPRLSKKHHLDQHPRALPREPHGQGRRNGRPGRNRYSDMDIHPSQLRPDHFRLGHQPRRQEHRLHLQLHRRRRGRESHTSRSSEILNDEILQHRQQCPA
ncbi:MAG: hypothetical protein ACLSH1_04495 [Clostridia bacterium]